MAAKIGILAESTTTTADSTITVYTVPADKAARIRLMFVVEGAGTAHDYFILIGSPGSVDSTIFMNLDANEDGLSGSIKAATPIPELAVSSGLQGLMFGADLYEQNFTNNLDLLIAPLAHDYLLSTGDTVRFRFRDNAPSNHLIQVMGVEDDA